MSKSELMKNFFSEQHRKWKSHAYALIHFTCKNAPFVSPYGKWTGTGTKRKDQVPAPPYRPKRD
ncbi:MAG TPA: hypothetical protein VHE12_02760 [bacterium]|nr:hypothetical protein [bacterium]